MKYAVVDLGGDMSPLDLRFYAAAQQIQLREHYAAHYDGDGDGDEVRAIVPGAAPLAPDEFPLRFHATVPAANAGDGAIGEHGLDGADIYRDLAVQNGDTWTSVGSHEALEARRDRRLHGCVELDNGEIWDEEICDRTEGDTYAIPVTIDGETRQITMSNFNTPACFEPDPAAPQPEVYDHMKLSTAPNQVRPTGYAQQFTLGQGWVQHGEMRGYRKALAERGLSRNAKRTARLGFTVRGVFIVVNQRGNAVIGANSLHHADAWISKQLAAQVVATKEWAADATIERDSYHIRLLKVL